MDNNDWPVVTLDEIFSIARGGSPRPISKFLTDDPNGVNWIMISDATEGEKYISSTHKRIIKEGVKKSRIVKPGDFLLTNSMSFGKPYIMNTTGCIHDGWLVLSPDSENVDVEYFYYLLGSNQIYTEFERRAAGATVKNLNIDLVKSVEIPLPPLGEQRRIAAVLDKADALRQKRRAALAKLDTLLQATFLHMFGDPVMNPMGWEVKELDDVIDFRTGKLDANAAVGDGQYPFFTCAREVSQIDHFAFDEEVLLMAGNNASADYWVKHFKGKFNAYQRTYVMTLKIPDLSYKYMRMAMEYKLGELKRISKGTNTRYLTLGLLKPLQVQIPDQKAMGKFEKLHDQIVYKKDQMEKGLEHLDNLFHALQQRAFSGQL